VHPPKPSDSVAGRGECRSQFKLQDKVDGINTRHNNRNNEPPKPREERAGWGAEPIPSGRGNIPALQTALNGCTYV